MSKRVKTVHIGKKDIYEWTMGEGKDIIFPLLFEASEKIILENKEKLKVLRVEAEIRGNQQAFDFWVNFSEIEDTLSKILDWALEIENYEMCQKLKELQNKLETF